MWIQLYHRHYGIHEPCSKVVEIPCDYEEIVRGEDNINEELLIAGAPEGYLPSAINRTLLCVVGVGQCGLKRFHNWAKYFDAYVIYLFKEKTGGG